MADRFDVSFRDETYGVDVYPGEGNHRQISIGAIPLSCTVSRSGKPECADLHSSVRSDVNIDVPSRELYTPSDFEEALGDDEMPGHTRFVIAHWARQSAEAVQD